MPVIVMLGAPLAGKGTQARLLSQSLGVPTLSTGDLFRAEAASGSDLGQRMKSYMDQGLLIPNELTTELLKTTLQKPLYEKGVLLDGYPRAISHLEILQGILLELDRELHAFVYLDVPKQVLVDRVAGRLMCSKCSATFSSSSETPKSCSSCGGELIHRSDDDIAVFEKRYAVFAEQTLPLVEYVKGSNLSSRLVTIRPTGTSSEEVHDEIRKQLDNIIDEEPSYQWIDGRMKKFLEENPSNPNFANFVQDLTIFRDKALQENIFRKTGASMRRFVYLQTSSVHKWKEHALIFDSLYGIEVLLIPTSLPEPALRQLILIRSKVLIPIAIIRETSNLFKDGTSSPVLSSLRHGVTAINRSHLRALSWSVSEQTYIVREYVYETKGTIDLSKRAGHQSTGKRPTSNHQKQSANSQKHSLNSLSSRSGSTDHLRLSTPAQGHLSSATLVSSDPTVFSWDDIFVAPHLPYTYHELRQLGFKHSSRDQVISDFIKDTIYYKDRLSLSFSNLSTKRVVDFEARVADLVDENEYYNNSFAVKYGYRRLIEHTINMGAFWRSAQNRRQNTYWCPGLNGGIPVVNKKDDKIHEDVFRAHDFGHYVVPDLIFTGNDSIWHRRAYVAYRMISEATTMSLADMLFVHALKTSGIDYDFSKRRIYPLFVALGLSFDEPEKFLENLKIVVRANFMYCLQGDDSEYKRLLKLNGQLDEQTGTAECLERFKEKYAPFFVEDFRWTEHNYDNMVQKGEDLRRWWDAVAPLRAFDDVPMTTVDDFLKSLEESERHKHVFDDPRDPNNSFVLAVFDQVFDTVIAPVFESEPPKVSNSQLLFRAFVRWITGQLAICSKYALVYKESIEVQKEIIAMVVEASADKNAFSINLIDKIRNKFEVYLSALVERCLISKDDESTYAEVYPLFDPYYVSYDNASSEYESLEKISKRIFSFECHFEKQIESIEKYVGCELTPREKRCVSFMTDMILGGGKGQIFDGLFVTRPGVQLLTSVDIEKFNALPHDQIMLSFLIAGVSVETSLEFCAHKESRVSRLTSSKTNAMSMPLFRVQGDSTAAQRIYLQHAVSARNRSLTKKQDLIEFSNMLLPASKCTALCYSMKLGDFHKLFIGRIPEPGNETEVRSVASRMADILHALFPKFILPSSEYVNASNSDKLKPISIPKPEKENIPAPSSVPSIFYASKITPNASMLFKHLNIDSKGCSAAAWAEFRSRLTYLAFTQTPADSWAYLNDMVYNKSHTSVLDGYQVVIDAGQLEPDQMAFSIPGSQRFMIVTLKELFAESHKTNASSSWKKLFELLRPSCPFLFDQGIKTSS